MVDKENTRIINYPSLVNKYKILIKDVVYNICLLVV